MVLIPIILIALVGAHVLMVRVRGVSHPIEAARPRFSLTSPRSWLGTAAERRAANAADTAAWRGPTRRYDILKEGTIAGLVVLILLRLVPFSTPFKAYLTMLMVADYCGCWVVEQIFKTAFSDFRPKDIALRRPDQIEREETRRRELEEKAERESLEALEKASGTA